MEANKLYLHKKETMSTVTFDFEIHPCLFQKTKKKNDPNFQ